MGFKPHKLGVWIGTDIRYVISDLSNDWTGKELSAGCRVEKPRLKLLEAFAHRQFRVEISLELVPEVKQMCSTKNDAKMFRGRSCPAFEND